MDIGVNYQRTEYLSILYDAVPVISIHRKSGTLPLERPSCGFFTKVLLNIFGSVAFFFKKRQVGSCELNFKDTTISRKSKSSDVTFELSKINYILELSTSFLIDVGKGAMPVPYRCFNKEQKHAFKTMYKEKIHSFESNET